MPRNPESPFEPPPNVPPTPEEKAAFERVMKAKPELAAALDEAGAVELRKDLDEATKRGENAALNLWATREVLKEKARTGDEPEKKAAMSEIEVLNVAIDELETGDPDAALQFYDFDNQLLKVQVEQGKDADQEIAALKRQKENLLKYALVKRVERNKK